MRIFHICDVGNKVNGIYSVLVPLSTEQRALGHEVAVYNIHKSGYNDDTLRLISTKDLIARIETEKPDIVLFHGIFYWAVIPISRRLISLKIPYLIELHGSMSLLNIGKSRFKKKLASWLFLNSIIRRAKAIVYLNMQEYCLSAIRQLNPKSIVIPNGIYRKQNQIPTDHLLNKKLEILYLGRIQNAHKGTDVLIEALKLLQDKGYDKEIHLSFYGKVIRSEEQWFDEQMKSISAIADFRGQVYGKDKEDAFSKANIFILTSRYEGFPMAILEALSYGCPCIVTPMTNIADIVASNRCGWITTLDPLSIAQTILEAAADYRANHEQLISRSRLAVEELEWSEIAATAVAKYQAALIDNIR